MGYNPEDWLKPLDSQSMHGRYVTMVIDVLMKKKQAIEVPAESTMTLHISDSGIVRCVCSPDWAKDRPRVNVTVTCMQHTMQHTGEYLCCVCRHPCKDSVCGAILLGFCRSMLNTDRLRIF